MPMPTMIIDHDDGQYLPEKLTADLVYVCEIDENPVSVHFVCPCGQDGCVVNIPTIPGLKSSWKVTREDGGYMTLEPSILNRRCGTHFWLKDGEIVE